MNMDYFKKSAAEASSFFNRAKQFTEEKLGGAERTFYDPELEALTRRADSTKAITERIIHSTTAVLQPNPNERLEDFVLTKLDRKVTKANNLELLGQCLIEGGQELGNTFQYSNTLMKVGETEKKLGLIEKEFVQKSSDCFLQPMKSFLDGQMKTLQKEKKSLEIKRLDLDSAKAKLKKVKEDRYKPEQQMLITKAEDELRRAQTDFDRQSELTKLLMDELTVAYNHHLQCLTDFVDAQLNHYNNCTKMLQDLSRQIGGVGIQQDFNKTITNSYNTSAASPVISNSNINHMAGGAGAAGVPNGNPSKEVAPAAGAAAGLSGFSILSGEAGGMHSVSLANNKRAKVLFDYEATDSNELSVFANQIVNIQILPNDNDWVLAESNQVTGKVPKAYIQIVD